MMKNLGPIPGVFPMPVLMVAAYDENGVVGVMNAAWGTICGSDKIALCISENHKTTQNICKTGAFTVAPADRAHMAQSDYFGFASGNKMPDKFAKSGMTAVESAFVHAPVITEYPLTMECTLCEVAQTEHLHMVVGKIVNVCAQESVLDAAGKVDAAKLDALLFDPFGSGYYTVGEQVGRAWNAGKVWMLR